jgi:flagella basal body P-ring formation protein FlgA
MYKQIALILIASLLCFSPQKAFGLPESKQVMIVAIKEWVTAETKLQSSQIKVNALDRRLQVPECGSDFLISFPYSKSQKTVKVECNSPQWSAYIGIQLDNDQPALMYVRSHSTGDVVTRDSVKPTLVSRSVRGTMSAPEQLAGKQLIRSVSEGQIVLNNQYSTSVTVFELKTDILKGELITKDSVTTVDKAYSSVSSKNSFPIKLLDNATAARDIRAKTILARSDLNIRHLVLMPTKTIARGEKLSSSNVEVRPFYGKLPANTLYLLPDVRTMESIRTLRPNQPIRSSDLIPSLMVKKGDSVILASGSGLLSITTTMVSLENGKLDQQINLLNSESNEKVRAIITGPGRARSVQSKIK